MKIKASVFVCALLVVAVTAPNAWAAATTLDADSIFADVLKIDRAQWVEMSKVAKKAHMKALPIEDQRMLRRFIREKTGHPSQGKRVQNDRVSDHSAAAKGTRAAGTITYDNNTSAGHFSTGNYKGNKFNQAISTGGGVAGVMTSGTISGFSAFMEYDPPPSISGTSLWNTLSWAIFGPESGGGAAQRLTNGGGGSGTGTYVHTFATPVNYTGSSFHIAIADRAGSTSVWTTTSGLTYTTYISRLAPAYASGTVLGLGIHGVSMPNSPTAAVAPLSVNMMVRAWGNVVVPVELMSFTIQ